MAWWVVSALGCPGLSQLLSYGLTKAKVPSPGCLKAQALGRLGFEGENGLIGSLMGSPGASSPTRACM